MADPIATEHEEEEAADPLIARINAFIESKVQRDSVRVVYRGGPVTYVLHELNPKATPHDWDEALEETKRELGYILRQFARQEADFVKKAAQASCIQEMEEAYKNLTDEVQGYQREMLALDAKMHETKEKRALATSQMSIVAALLGKMRST